MILYFVIYIICLVSIWLVLKYKFPVLYSKVKNIYIYIFSKLLIVYKYIVKINKSILLKIKSYYQSGNYVKMLLLGIAYLLFFLVQLLFYTTVIVSYLICKFSGVCLLI